MPEVYLKVKGKQRTIDEAKDGIIYKLTLVKKEGKRGEPLYLKWQLTLEEGSPNLYNRYEPEDLIKVQLELPQKRLDEFKEG